MFSLLNGLNHEDSQVICLKHCSDCSIVSFKYKILLFTFMIQTKEIYYSQQGDFEFLNFSTGFCEQSHHLQEKKGRLSIRQEGNSVSGAVVGVRVCSRCKRLVEVITHSLC